ncbi:VOC family protein [Leucobacter weissii]|uniref:VOC family protein n=1 Tax=Leucobacter weissii TaxID=1983706 RepID=A0A939SA24_9MICO|nr:VOC family protein [Leucobacter weissii]
MSFSVEGLHHVGITVRDMKRSFEWYSTMFGLEHGPVNHNEGAELEAGVEVPGAVLDYSMIEVGSTRIEFLEYTAPEGEDFSLRNCDVGAAHLCFQVDDMEEAYRALTERGAVFNAPPVTLSEGALAGSQWAYLRDPDGVQLELWQWPR